MLAVRGWQDANDGADDRRTFAVSQRHQCAHVQDQPSGSYVALSLLAKCLLLHLVLVGTLIRFQTGECWMWVTLPPPILQPRTFSEP